MKLVPFLPKYLRPGEALPFGVRDAEGRLLLAAGQSVTDVDHLQEICGSALFAEESESAGWFKRLAAAMDEQIRMGAALHQVAAARPEMAARETPATPVTLSFQEEWTEVVLRLDAALRDLGADTDWRGRLLGSHVRARQLAEKRPDASLYHLIYEAAHSTHKYSSHHAVVSMLICELAAPLLGCARAWIDSLGRAALVMNVAMLRLQDQLASDPRPPTPEMREQIQQHAERGAEMLRDAGLADPLCLEVVRLHHDAGEAQLPLAELSPARQLARLLRRVDSFSAQISVRASRPPLSPVQAAANACLSPAGVPDEVGGAILRAVGMYPPGSYVELACGEIGIVIARGRRANLPYVASLVSPAGQAIAEPALRDTLDRRYTVKSAVQPSQVKVRPPHARLLAMR